ncbi:MAG TPA: tail fiber domain-containing protein [Verrucomicrobiae bacterium]|nr:tail fiber domain-containing protein [Verrucomicrobiae bacterium]
MAKVTALHLTEWNFKNEIAEIRHVGPMAQDFHAAFQLNGSDDKHISVIDEAGVALVAIQGLNQKLEAEAKEKDAEIENLKAKAGQVDSLQKQLNELKQTVQLLAQKK